MTSVIESSLRAEIAALHEQIKLVYNEISDSAYSDCVEIDHLVGMLPDEIRPKDVLPYSPHPGPFKTKKPTADDLL